MSCATFKNGKGPVGDYLDPEQYWDEGGRQLCICGHPALEHYLKYRACAVCLRLANDPSTSDA